jgi:hypothetical protein
MLSPAIKAATINLPIHLPPAPQPIPEVDVTSLVVDEELDGVPVGYLVAKLRAMGTSPLSSLVSSCPR